MKSLLLLSFFLLLNERISCQDNSLLHSIRQDSALDLYLTLDWKNIEKNKKDPAYQHCDVKLITGDHDSITLSGKVKTRGHMRLDICSFPPLKLKLDKSDLAKYDLSTLNEMDLVHHCEEGDQFNQYLLREYLAYKLWELISPYHFNVQLLRLHYTNIDGSQAHETSYAYLVDNEEELVDRLGGKSTKIPVISNSAVEKEPMLKVALFEFMIGNTDWFILNRHNLEFVGIPGYTVLVPIPYDFDYSGLVSTPYSVHHESLNLSSVTMRYYQGWCNTEAEVNEALKIFREQKQNILMMCSRIQGFNEKSVKHTTAYLQSFFEIIENPKKLENQIIQHCDMWPVKD